MPQRATTPNLPGIPTVPRLGGGAVGPFSPDQIAGLQAWYKDTGIVDDGVNVSQWSDSSGNGNHLTPIGAQPDYLGGGLNSRDIVGFTTPDGSVGTALHRNAALMAGTAATMFMVANKQSTWGESGLYTTRAVAQANHHPFSDLAVYDAFFSSARKACGAQVQDIPDTWTIIAIRSQASDYRMHVNGVLQHQTSTNTFALGSDFVLGCGAYDGANTTYALDGFLAEVIVYNQFLSDGQLDQVIGYLRDRFNL